MSPHEHGRASVVVLGSLNVDSTSYVAGFPAPGETIESTGFQVALGGKGTNQAVAAHLAGASVALVARIGADAAGAYARETVRGFGLSDDAVEEVADAATGVAQITVAASGENTVIVSAGANAHVTADLVDAHSDEVAASAVALTQGEVPRAAIERLAVLSSEVGTRFVLNLAPPVAVAAETLAVCDPLVVNEHEAVALGIGGAESASLDDWRAVAASVAGDRCRSIVVTLGSQGAVAADASGSWATAAPRVTAVDSTGAGDCFTGTLAAFLAEGRPLEASMRLAVAAGALSVQARGTVASYAPRAELLAYAAAEGLH